MAKHHKKKIAQDNLLLFVKDIPTKIETDPKEKGVHIGGEYHTKLKDFIANGGDVNSCPFDHI